jgi:hypothetical protein
VRRTRRSMPCAAILMSLDSSSQARQAIDRDIDGSTIPSGAIPPSISQARLSAKTMPPNQSMPLR